MKPTIVSFSEVCFGYQSELILQEVSFEIDRLDLVAMVGPNGGGKTTLFRLILGLEKPSCGRVQVFGSSPTAVSKRIGYVPQHLQFDPQFPVTVLDVVLMGRVEKNQLGFYSSTDKEKALYALERVSLAALASRPFSALSGGERQRVLIAQALSSEPELLLLDEPTASVDCVVEHELYDLLKRLNQELTIVMSSHNLGVVTRHVSRVLCVNRKVDIHQACELTVDILHEAYASDMAVLRHAATCPVIDPPSSTEHSEHEHSFERRNKDD